MNLRWLRIVPYRLRLLLRAAFLLLAVATVGLALSVLQQEKQLSYKSYQTSFQKTGGQIAATLRHPAGQLALLNPPRDDAGSASLHPVLLPFSALDFDDQQKVQQAVAMSGCLIQYGASGTLCVGIGNNPWAGGFIYVAGSFDSPALVAHAHGDRIVRQANRVRVKVSLRGQTNEWIAPFEEVTDAQKGGQRRELESIGLHGRLTGFRAEDEGSTRAYAVKDFRGWIWQNAQCNAPARDDADPACLKNTFFSLRLPVGLLRDALFSGRRPVWPPADLDRIDVTVKVLPPGDGPALLDSASSKAIAPFSLKDLAALLLPGETLDIRAPGGTHPLIALTGAAGSSEPPWHVLTMLIRHLPIDAYDTALEDSESIVTPTGAYEVKLKGDARSVNESLSIVASRLAWFVGAMLLALFLAWLVVEIGIIRRIKVLIARADSVAKTVKGAGELEGYDLSDLRGADELGVLASCLHDLLRRVREDVEREGIRAEQERDMWHAVGHEIMSPLQSLMALHGAPADQSHRYISRMQQAVRVLYGSASPSEAFQSTVLQIHEIDLPAFLHNVAQNAPCVGIEAVMFSGVAETIMVRADEYSLEDVVTHVLRNADRYRDPGSVIDISLAASETGASITIRNRGPTIAPDLIGKIFEYGVSDQQESGAHGNRGQGLFVAKIYMAKMGGTITAYNQPDGVSFILSLQRAMT